jgi:hypothetical protein
MIDPAPGWRVRCLTCGRWSPLGRTGATRLGAASKGKRTLVWCSRCRWLRCAAVERTPDANRISRARREWVEAGLVELRRALDVERAELLERHQAGDLEVQRYKIGTEVLLVSTDGLAVEVEGPEPLVRRVVATARGGAK